MTAAATFFGIGMGHVGARKVEAASPSLWLPSLSALGLGDALEIGPCGERVPIFPDRSASSA
ncbi:MAG: hypothetical protein WD040_06745 [Anaerolineales bacterium]